MPQEVIKVQDLVKKYGNKDAVLRGVSFTVDKGEFVMIYGRSGCGKTTILNILGGLDRPSSGAVIIDGVDIVDLSEDELAMLRLNKIGFVFQDYNLLMDLTVRQNVSLPLRFSKRPDDGRVDSLLKRFDIAHIANETANKISGGEAQRAAIARAMMNEPSVILADEPTGNLDSENTENVLAVFESLRRDFGTTILLATHDESLARHSSRKLLLEDGRTI